MESPYAPHDSSETREMLDAIGVESVDDLFDVPTEVRFEGEIDVEPRTEREALGYVRDTLGENEDAVDFLGRGHYSHYVPSAVDHLADRSEFLTSYTQYQPEVTQGFLQALFEYQSMVTELTGLGVANASMYDYATALGEAALLAARTTDGELVHVPENLLEDRARVLDNYVEGTELEVREYSVSEGTVDLDELGKELTEDSVMVYAESPNARGVLEENLDEIAGLAGDYDALACLGSDPVALSVLEKPSELGFDAVVGDASVLGLPDAFGMQLGLFAVREKHLRQIPGRLVGASEDDDGVRCYTLTLQTREQHIRKERATSNICTNQAWLALRAAIHTCLLGPEELVELAEDCVTFPEEAARELDAIEGISAPVYDAHHFREFSAEIESGVNAYEVRDELAEKGYLVHAVDVHEIQVCVTRGNTDETDGLVAALNEVVG
ncbi:MAG: aminomethyl-transferring glycine dehydrogenase subunit GcvPA [Halobacteria archaeon]